MIVWVSTIASVVGAGFAMYQASLARSSADKAEKVKKDLISRRKLEVLSKIMTETKHIHSRFKKYVNPKPGQMSGDPIRKDIDKLQNFLYDVRDSKGSFQKNQNKIEDTVDTIDKAIEAQSSQNKKGRQIFDNIKRIHALLREELDGLKNAQQVMEKL